MPTLIPLVLTGLEQYLRLPRSERQKTHKLGTLSCVSLITNKMIGTGLFSTPSIIFKYCDGNVPLYLGLWVLGAFIIFSGLLIYLEFALNLPLQNGGEKNYLLRVFKLPKGLAGCVYAFQMVFLGFSSGNSFAFGKYIWYAVSGNQVGDDDWTSKLIGVVCITGCIWLHIQFPNQATLLFNFLGMFKIVILMLIIAIGSLVAIDVIGIPEAPPAQNLHTGVLSNFYSISVALLEIVYSFKGWENANYVLSEIADPYHVLTIAAPMAVLLVTILYFLVIISYLIVIPKEELLNSGVLVAGIFFNKVFGESVTSKMLPLMIALLTLGNVMVVSFAHSIVNQELARNNYLPFSKTFENLNYSLILHWFVTVVILVGPPSADVYEFVVNLYIYPGTWINVAITGGLVYLKLNAEKEGWGRMRYVEDLEIIDDEGVPLEVSTTADTDLDSTSIQSYNPQEQESGFIEFNNLILSHSHLTTKHKSFSASWVCVVLFFIANVFLAILPFFPPPKGTVNSTIPYWCFPVVGTGCLLIGAVFYFGREKYYLKKGWTPPVYEDEYQN